MAYEVNTGSTAIDFGETLKIGYRVYGSAGSFTYLTPLPGYNDLPYTFSLPAAGTWEIQYIRICPSCSGSKLSNPATAVVVVV